MRVCIIGDRSEPLDEGMKKTTAALVSALSNYCEVTVLNPLKAAQPGFWIKLVRAHPDIIHYIPGPSLYSFMILAAAKALTSAGTVMSLTHPDPQLPKAFACRFFKPDLMLSQTQETEQDFRKLGCRLDHLPNGVDTHQFHIFSQAEKYRLRQKYGIPAQAFIALHVGNTRQVRNLESLTNLQGNGTQVVIVSSTTIQGDSAIDTNLKAAGCIVLNRYIEAIEEIYGLADCYVFPTINQTAAIAHPLSVMEAMACNLPVVTRKFGILPRLFKPGDGLYFFDTDEELIDIIREIRNDMPSVTTHARIRNLNWDAIARRALQFYQSLNTNEFCTTREVA